MKQKQKFNYLEKNIIYSSLILIFFSVLILILVLTLVWTINKNEIHFNEYDEIMINLSELSDRDAEIVNKLIRDLNEDYLLVQRSITFAYNVTNLYEDCCGETNPLWGFNKEHGDNYIKYRNNTGGMKITLCHELLHTIIPSSTDEAHDLIRDLASQGVCYSKSNRFKLNLK